ncbi:MAG: TIGR04283 family arsenosugar biosynthesis glycosyltransferase [Pseudomonadota bacterium]
MRLSVIVPTLNEAQGVATVLAPLQALRAAGHEIIVADGGSADATPVLAAPLADRVLAAPRGRARQMNAGASAARGDAFLFLHADTRLPANATETIAQALDRNAWGRFDVRIEGPSPWLRVIAPMMNLRSRLTGIATGDQAIFVTRAAFEAVGGFPDQPLMEDIELTHRLKRFGPPACLRERVATSGRRWERHGVWPTILLMWRLRFDYWRGVTAQRLAERYYPEK